MSQFISIPIIFDKSHLLTIGERLYSTSLDLIRELISNAYDADATRVTIQLKDGEIIVEDNGSGMSERDLRQYFTIGSQEKRIRDVSPCLHRKRIGEFGIGKFSALTIADRFTIETQKEDARFRARLVFDAEEWRRDQANWEVPCEYLPYDESRPSGTTITLQKLKKPLDPSRVIRHIRERLPLGKTDFRIIVNGSEVGATVIPGKRFPVSFSTPFGEVRGEIILANLPMTQRNIADAGVTICVKQIAITKSLFGYEASHSLGINRMRGSVNADFLPITSSRDQIIQDSDEYQVLYDGMRRELRGILRDARNLVFQKENMLASQVLREALDNIGRALKKNPDVFRETGINAPIGFASVQGPHAEEGYTISKAEFLDSPSIFTPEGVVVPDASSPTPVKRKHISVGQRAIIRKMRFQNLGIICRMERYGAEQPPSFLEQGIIFLNIDHPLYRKQMENAQLLKMYITTLIGKEIAIQKHPHDAPAAFHVQTQLLTDAFKDVRRL